MSTGIGAKMAGGNPDPARGREADDFYPTPSDVTEALLRRHGDGVFHDCWAVWEPCAGDGAMADVLARHGFVVLSSDINPRRPDIQRKDFLATRPGGEGHDQRVRAIITNPPFDLADEMIEHALGFGVPFAFVLKATFWHARRRRRLWEMRRPAFIHPLRWRPDFKNLGRPTMEVMWCVWGVGHGQALYEPLDRPETA